MTLLHNDGTLVVSNAVIQSCPLSKEIKKRGPRPLLDSDPAR